MVMQPANIERRELAGGEVQLSAGRCIFSYRRLRPGALLVTIRGEDLGQFGSATVDEVAAEFKRFGQPIGLYVDLRQAKGPATVVMETWTEWLAAQRANLRRVVILVPPESPVLHLTISIAQHLSRTGNLLRLCGDAGEFQRALADEAPGFQLDVGTSPIRP
jgi:hypothetical protein